jgi:hypothetical protein
MMKNYRSLPVINEGGVCGSSATIMPAEAIAADEFQL